MLADVPGRSRYALTYEEVLGLPLRIRDRMLEQMQEWRAHEEAGAGKK